LKKPTLGLCLMVWNELEGCQKDIPRLPFDHFDDVFAVEGGSTDGTVEYLRQLGVRLVRQTKRGYNWAYITGFENCNCDALVFYHPKGTIDPQSVLQFRRFFDEGAHLVVASRNISGGRNEEDGKLLKPRKWFVSAMALLCALVWRREGEFVHDVLHGYRGMTRAAFWAIDPLSDGLSMDLQMVVRCYRAKLMRSEFPVRENSRTAGETHFRALPTGWKLLKYLWRELFRPAPVVKDLSDTTMYPPVKPHLDR